MNWTGGRLQRHSKKNKGTSAVDKQKAYFAKARTKLQNGPNRVSTFDPSFLDVGRDGTRALRQAQSLQSPQRQQVLEEFEDTEPIVRRSDSICTMRRTQRASNSLENICPTIVQKSIIYDETVAFLPSTATQASIPRTKFDPGTTHCNFKRPGQSIPSNQTTNFSSKSPGLFDEAALINKRRELLDRPDWVGLESSRPLQLDFVSSHGREQVAKRRRVNHHDQFRQAVTDERMRVPSIDEHYMMSGVRVKDSHNIQDIVRIKIGEDALMSQSANQSSHISATIISPRTSSGSMMLEDEEQARLEEITVPQNGHEYHHSDVSRVISKPSVRNTGFSSSAANEQYFHSTETIPPIPPKAVSAGTKHTVGSSDLAGEFPSIYKAGLNPFSRCAEVQRSPVPLFVFPSSDSKSIDSLLEDLDSCEATIDTVRHRKRGQEADRLQEEAEHANRKADDDNWKQFIRVPASSTCGDLGTAKVQSGCSREFSSGMSWNGFPSSTGATAGNLKIVDAGDVDDLMMTFSSPDSVITKWQLRNHRVVNRTRDQELEATLNRSTSSSISVEETIPPVIQKPKDTTASKAKPSAIEALDIQQHAFKSAQDAQDDLWRAFVFGNFNSSSPKSMAESNDDDDRQLQPPVLLSTNQQHSSLDANASTSTGNTTTISNSDTSILSAAPASSTKTTAATHVATSSLGRYNHVTTVEQNTNRTQIRHDHPASTSSFSRPSSLMAASTTAAVLRTQQPLRQMTSLSSLSPLLSSSDPLTRDENFCGPNEMMVRKRASNMWAKWDV